MIADYKNSGATTATRPRATGSDVTAIPEIGRLSQVGTFSPQHAFKRRRLLRNFRLALHKSNVLLADFKYGSGDGVRLPKASAGHSYQHIQKKRRRSS